MNRTRKSLKTPRQIAFRQQNEHCWYCSQPMWEKNSADFRQRFNLTESQARKLQCTGEHLLAWRDGGTNKQENIVAACWYCNSRRHRGKKELDPLRHRDRVQRELQAEGWHGLRLTNTPTQ
ncbi:MAG: hypothetical protein A3H44_06440 [Gammaproteobacteria bacterium RIFCSPLOWO2_02_FULL_57_10]|nr:MAG: hypothetical protein A3H44_06440 [Gammaproteobacteria bacterium RIFCSPLOWO2_02_FULL_57_10]